MYDKNVFMQLYFSIFCTWSGAIFVRMYDIYIYIYIYLSYVFGSWPEVELWLYDLESKLNLYRMSSGLSMSNLSPIEASKKMDPQVDLWSYMTVKVSSIFL